jgi:heptosyltransferase-2
MRILILRLSSLGDIVLTQPVVARLRELYTRAEINFACKPQYQEIPALFGSGINTIAYSKRADWHLALTRQRYDLVLDLHGKLSTWLVSMLVPSPRKAVYDKQRRRRLGIVRGNKDYGIGSTVSLYWSTLERLFPKERLDSHPIPHPRLYPELLPDSVRPVPRKYPGRRLLGLFPGAAHATKMWPLEYWRELIGSLESEYEIRLYGNRSEQALEEPLLREFPTLTGLCGKLDIQHLVKELAGCDAVISGDSGPMHLAAAMQIPQVAIFGGTHPRLGFAPLNDKAVVLYRDLDCQPCSLHGKEYCPLRHFDCMRQITPEQVSQALSSILK